MFGDGSKVSIGSDWENNSKNIKVPPPTPSSFFKSHGIAKKHKVSKVRGRGFKAMEKERKVSLEVEKIPLKIKPID